MADFTLSEVHLHDGSEFNPTSNASLLSKGVGTLTDADNESHDDYDAEFDTEFDADESDEFDKADDTESGGRPRLGPLIGLVLLVGIAAAVRYIHDGDDDLDELANLGDTGDEERDEVGVSA